MFALLLMIYLLPVLVVLCLLVRIVRWSVVMILRISLKLIRRILRLSWCLICWLWHHAINRYREYRMRSVPWLLQMDFGDNREIKVCSLLWDLSGSEAELSAEAPFHRCWCRHICRRDCRQYSRHLFGRFCRHTWGHYYRHFLRHLWGHFWGHLYRHP